jgi:pyrimidine-nucleoside phosphorylase
MLPLETIRKRRDAEQIEREELAAFFGGYLRGDIPDYQMAAFLMASFFSPVNFEETLALTGLFLESGNRLDLSSVQGPKVDKHSTGGVGDKTSLLVAPIAAAAGVKVPMISGRALGHTGGTLDKLESIPGFSVNLDGKAFLDVLERSGIAMAGQSDGLVPLDKKVYALRDVTATVEILPLIAASIISKKVAGGASALILDVKCGAGAFMKEKAQALELASLLVSVGEHFGLRTSAVLSDMEQPLGRAVGVWLEVVEAVDCLQGSDAPDLLEVSCALAGMMIHAGGKAHDIAEGVAVARDMLRGGLAWERFIGMAKAQGGDVSFLWDTLRYRNASSMIDVPSPRDGIVRNVDARQIGMLASVLGAGRLRTSDAIDATAGVVLMKKRGDAVEAGESLCRLYSSRISELLPYREQALSAYSITGVAAPDRPLLYDYVDAAGVKPWTEVVNVRV